MMKQVNDYLNELLGCTKNFIDIMEKGSEIYLFHERAFYCGCACCWRQYTDVVSHTTDVDKLREARSDVEYMAWLPGRYDMAVKRYPKIKDASHELLVGEAVWAMSVIFMDRDPAM